MKGFNRIFAAVIVLLAAIFVTSNMVLTKKMNESSGKQYLVDVNRLVIDIERRGEENVELDKYEHIVKLEKYDGQNDFYKSENTYVIREINGELYRFDCYTKEKNSSYQLIFNVALGCVSLVLILLMLFIKKAIIRPFERFKEVPYELAKGHLTVPIKENKNKFFSKFSWGLDLLREKLEEQKGRELYLQKEKKTLLLSLSHDIKTPLSAIKLYSKALSKGLYKDAEKQKEIAESMNEKADEIENFVSQIINASRENFLSIEVSPREVYLNEIINKITEYYSEKMELTKTDFEVGEYTNCLINADTDRSVEVLQNIIENALKYGDGHSVSISFSEEEDCVLVSVTNRGCTLDDSETVHIFESFWRGSNAENVEGSGLGLYICRQIMHKMNGDIFAKIADDEITVTALFSKVV